MKPSMRHTLLVLCAVLAVPAPVAAFKPGQLERAKQVAATYWGAAPACSPVVTKYREINLFQEDGEIARIGVEPTGACELTFDSRPEGYYQSLGYIVTGPRFTWTKLCSLMVRGYGRLLDRPVGGPPWRIMSPDYDWRRYPVRRCVRRS